MILKQFYETFTNQASAIAAVLAALFASACGPPPLEDLCTADRKAVCEKQSTQCQTFICAPDTGSCKGVDKPDKDKCDDDDKCTKDDACLAGKCKAGAEVDKSDGDVCTDDKCDSKIGVTHPPNTEPCDDADACTDKDKCKEGKCAGLAKDCNDNNPCTEDEKCNKASGKCANEAKDATCSDSDACTKDDKCVGGKCEGKPETTDDKDPCTKDACDPKAGFSHVPIPDAPCDDGDVCTESDKCDALGKCKPGKKVEIDDNEPCTKDGCDSKAGPTHTPLLGEPCDDKDACTEGDKCSASGKCLAGTAIKVEDGNPCTKDSCDKAKGVQNAPDDSATFDDGDACTVGDKCVGGKGQPGAKPGCPDKDGDSCTIDQCDPKAGCVVVKAADGTPCKDGNECTDNDSCLAAVCKPGPEKKCTNDGKQCQLPACEKAIGCTLTKASDGTDCDDGTKCTEPDKCLAGACAPGLKVECNDNNPCTKDSCDSKLGCVHDAKSLNGSVCDDKTACTQNEVCTNGACVPPTPAKSCDDGNECTSENCDPLTGKCNGFNAKDGTVCDDGDKCTGASFCDIGKCIGKSPVVCKNDGNECTDDGCDKFTGCAYPSLEGKPCIVDDNVCTPDTCKGVKCVAGPIKSCDDKNPCTEDSCDKVKGCLNLPADGLTCDDGLVCTVEDKCKGGKCVDVKAKNCSDGNSCTEDTCAEPGGCKNMVLLDNSVCDDGDSCSTGDVCTSGACKSTGAALWQKKDPAIASTWNDSVDGITSAGDGGFVMAGYVAAGPNAWGGVITRVDATGAILFQKFLKDNQAFSQSGDRSQLSRVAALKDGFVAVGSADPNKSGWTANRPYVVKVSPTGGKLCEKAHDGDGGSFTGVAALGNGGFVATGYHSPAKAGRITEFDAACSPGAETIIGATNASYSAVACKDAAVAPVGGGYWVVCHQYLKTGGTDAFVFRVIAGQVVKTKFVGLGQQSPGWRGFERIVADAAGATAFGAWSGQIGDVYQPMILRLDNDANGKEVLQSGPGVFRDGAALPDGGYVAVGWTEASGTRLATVSRITESGLLQSTKTITSAREWAAVAVSTSGYLGLAGHTASPPVAGEVDGVYAITDAFGNQPCGASGTCIGKKPADLDDKNPCTLDWCEAGQPKYSIGNEGLTCAPSKTCQKGKCL